MSEVPEDRFYLSSHEWAQEGNDGVVTTRYHRVCGERAG